MKKFVLVSAAFALSFQLKAQHYQQTTDGLKAKVAGTTIEIQFYTTTIVRVLKYPADELPKKENLSVIKKPDSPAIRITESANVVLISSSDVSAVLNLSTGDVAFRAMDTRPLIAEKSGTTRFTSKEYKSGKTHEVQQTFLLDKQEAVYGLGQHQQGHMNQRGREVVLRQANTEIAMPIIHSVKGYALLWDNYSPSMFKDGVEGMTITSAAGSCVDYYFMYGKNADGTIAQIRELTGQAPMFPLWTYGFWQSRERYTSQNELVGAVKRYRDLNIPLDGIVQDWQYWSTDNKYWNAVAFGNPEFPDPKKMVDDVHQLNAHIAISVWPSFGPETKIHQEFKKKHLLYDYDTFPHRNGVKVYDAFNPEARDIYWKYMDKNLFSLGMDGWWLDATEAEFLGGDENFNQLTHLGPLRNVFNAFPLATVGTVYDHQRRASTDKRVFILTRSAFVGQQRFGANSWSGDIDSRWSVLRNQISAGLNFSLSGIPYWNADIGGFWAGRVYPKGIKDKAFHELYVRWMQFATFTPMMRSHGTNTPREIYMFGNKGDWSYDVQEKYIRLRYNLLPYLYTAAYDITNHAGTMMRALIMDFADDIKVHDINDEYMFGKSLLVAPVTDSMYVDRADGQTTEHFQITRSRPVYLPKGTDWYDFWTGGKNSGGQELSKASPIDVIPLYVRAGSILPWGPDVQFATERKWDSLDLFIYPGADAEYILYEDENDNYNYERGAYSTIRIHWAQKDRTLTIGDAQGQYPGMLTQRAFRITVLEEGKSLHTALGTPDKTINYQGKEIKLKI